MATTKPKEKIYEIINEHRHDLQENCDAKWSQIQRGSDVSEQDPPTSQSADQSG